MQQKKRWQQRREAEKLNEEMKRYQRLCRALEKRSELVRQHVKDSVRANTPSCGHGAPVVQFWIGILWRMDDDSVLATTFGGTEGAA